MKPALIKSVFRRYLLAHNSEDTMTLMRYLNVLTDSHNSFVLFQELQA